MQNYLILYNPYYENNVIGKYLEILKIYGQVAFGKVRDVYLANFTTPKYNNHTFTIYGNPYEYPLRIEPKKPEDYFIDSKTYYIDALQSQEFIDMKQRLVDFNLGESFMKHCLVCTLENITKAELELQKIRADKQNSADCSSIIIYARNFEQEMWEFAKRLFAFFWHTK